jgi:hypothetical protein
MKERALNNKIDIKIFILFLLDNVDYPLDDETISNIIVENGYVGSFDFTECFSELLELEHIVADEVEGKTYYTISESGRLVSSELQDSLLESIREASSQSASHILSLHKRGAHVETDMHERLDKKIYIECRVVEKNGILFSFGVTVSSKMQAEKIRDGFSEKPEKMFRGLMAVLTGNVDYLLD